MTIRAVLQAILCVIAVHAHPVSGWAAEFMQVPAAIHIASRVSDGRFSILEIAQAAKKNNFGVVIITDRDLARWEYGLWPLRSLIKRVVQGDSVFSYGITRYLKDVDAAQKANSGMVILAGLESAPFYYFEGRPFTRGFTLRDTNKHLLAIGLENAHDMRRMPVIGNLRAWGVYPSGLRILSFCLGCVGVAIGILCMRQRYRNYFRLWQASGACLVIAGAVSMVSALPFVRAPFDQYYGDRGVLPYQRYIDYVTAHKAMVFWAHPESEFTYRDRSVAVYTPAYPDDLLATQGYTGFEVFYAGEQRVGCIGGVWDQVLLEYCSGARRTPVWAIAGSGFDASGELSSSITQVRTVLLVEELNRSAVCDALRAGRMYASCGIASANFSLDVFAARDPLGAVRKTMGQELALEVNPVIEISGHFFDGQELPLRIQLIKNGALVKAFEVESPFHIFYEDTAGLEPGRKQYYRIAITGRDISLITNPVFVTNTAD